MAEKFVLVTGASNGQIGTALVLAFQQKGLTAFATSPNPQTAVDFSTLPNVYPIQLDLASEDSIAEAVELVHERTSGKGLDVLMNSARVEFVMPVLDTSVMEGKRLFDINIWGKLAMVKAFTPQLVRNKGVVLNMSSISGLINSPWIGIYAASQSALITMSETLRLELAPFHVRVLTLVAGCVEADIPKRPGEFQLPANSIYSRILSTLSDTAEGKLDPETMPAEIYASRVVADVLKERTGMVYRGKIATVTRIASWLPAMLLDGMLSAKRVLLSWPGLLTVLSENTSEFCALVGGSFPEQSSKSG